MSLPNPMPDSHVAVTGAASGIGEALVHELAKLGHDVLAIDINDEGLETVAAAVRQQRGTAVATHVADLSVARQRNVLIERIEADPRALVGLCNNAGMWSGGAFHELPYDREARIVAVNVAAVHHLTAALLPGMVARECGAILNVASVGANAPMPFSITYGATKAFAHSFSEGLHAELAGTGVSCTSLQPGLTDTHLADTAPGGEGGLLRIREVRASNLIFQQPEQVAAAAVKGMRRGDRVVVPSASWHYFAGPFTRHAPRTLLLPVVRMGLQRLIRPGSATH